MATMNFSVPDDVKQAFNRAFAGRNKSAIVAELMMRAVEEKEEAARRTEAIDRLLELRAETRPVPAEEIRAVRDELRQ
ncbi:MAG: hypothetical protein H0X65_00065 [Gemmatimonadetes bacterium]|nr:hypothetical protein [Gemmatimonadota bacterium]